MMTIHEYQKNRLNAIDDDTYEALEKVFDEENSLCAAWQNDEIDIIVLAALYNVNVTSEEGYIDLIQWMHDCDD